MRLLQTIALASAITFTTTTTIDAGVTDGQTFSGDGYEVTIDVDSAPSPFGDYKVTYTDGDGLTSGPHTATPELGGAGVSDAPEKTPSGKNEKGERITGRKVRISDGRVSVFKPGPPARWVRMKLKRKSDSAAENTNGVGTLP